MVSKKNNLLFVRGSDRKIRPPDHRLSSLGKPHDANIGDPLDGFFYPTLTFIMDFIMSP